jgi:AraC family transcriptional regulator
MSGVPSGVLRRLPIIAWTFVSGPTNRSRRVGTDQPIEANGEQIKAGEIPGGRCAVLRVVGNTHNLEPAALYLYREWLPASGEEARDFPIYCQRLSFPAEVPEHEAVAELFLPLK